MSRRPAVEAEALVVRLVDFGESDRIVGLFTRELGLVSAIARGARRSARRFAGALQTGQRIVAELGLASGSLHRLEGARLVDPHLGLLRELPRLDEAALLLRILRDNIPEGEPDAELFERSVAHLSELSEHGADPRRLLGFRLLVLDRLGIGPELESCVRCGRAAPAERPACVDARLGGLVCRACGGAPLVLSAEARRLARSLRDGAPSGPGRSIPLGQEVTGATAAAPDPEAALAELGRALDALGAVHLARRGGDGGESPRSKGK